MEVGGYNIPPSQCRWNRWWLWWRSFRINGYFIWWRFRKYTSQLLHKEQMVVVQVILVQRSWWRRWCNCSRWKWNSSSNGWRWWSRSNNRHFRNTNSLSWRWWSRWWKQPGGQLVELVELVVRWWRKRWWVVQTQ